MKKVFAVLLAVMLLVSSIASVSAADNPTFVLGKAAFANKGDTATMTVKAENFSSVSVIHMVLLYDSEKIELQNISDGSGDAARGVVIGAEKNGFLLVEKADITCIEPGKINVVWDVVRNVSLNEVILEFEFKSLVDGPLVEKLEISDDENDERLIKYDLIEDEAFQDFMDVEYSVVEEVIGFNVSGTVTSYLDANEKVTVELYEEGNAEPSYSATVTGNSGTYSFSEVPSGTYTMKVSKKGHVTKEIVVTVIDGDVTQDVTINLYGDVNSDGMINTQDATLALRIAINVAVEGVNREAADYNGDGVITTQDATLILRRAINIETN